ncbi:hypothetical protein [Arthrobacter sp. UYEF20]|uniref:hypothetical protein n=1 Tax=Arthrobacter sp. UYEF20 TaxID=1756363 RepID=UPI0033944190
MGADRAEAEHILTLLEHAVETLTTGTERIQQRLADAYRYSLIADDANSSHRLPPTVYALQLDLREAMTTVHDGERGWATASAATLTDDQCVIFARRILDAARLMRDEGGSARVRPPGLLWERMRNRRPAG